MEQPIWNQPQYQQKLLQLFLVIQDVRVFLKLGIGNCIVTLFIKVKTSNITQIFTVLTNYRFIQNRVFIGFTISVSSKDKVSIFLSLLLLLGNTLLLFFLLLNLFIESLAILKVKKFDRFRTSAYVSSKGLSQWFWVEEIDALFIVEFADQQLYKQC